MKIITKPNKATLEIGGKANNLLLLEQMNLHVPQWVVIPSTVLDNLTQNLTQDMWVEGIDQLDLPHSLFSEMHTYFGKKYKELSYAVRSSAIGEDGQEHSFAGLYTTKLNVPFDGLTNAVKAVWKSTRTDHLMAYKKQKGLAPDSGIAVIIQEMVPAEVSGVAFGQDPLTGDTTKKVISSVFGLGEGLVSGELKADNYHITESNIETQLAKKEEVIRASQNKDGLTKEKIEPELENQSSLNQEQVLDLEALLHKLNEKTGVPQDVEFAYHKEQLYVLQTRPITSSAQPEVQESILWDNSNIIESYPGVTTPMTFSFIKKMYSVVYQQLLMIMGVNSKQIQDHSAVFDNTLGLIRGRVYYNLISWHKMLAMIPGYSINADFMDNMMGVKEKYSLSETFKMNKLEACFRTIWVLIKMIGLHINLPRQRKLFKASLDKKIEDYGNLSYDTMSTNEIIDQYKIFEKTLLQEWKAPLVNDFFSMIWFGLLKKQTAQYFPQEANIHNDLLCSSEDIISVQPIIRTIALAANIKSDKDAYALFTNQSSVEIWEILKGGAYKKIKSELDTYLKDFGERCMGELKLETISYGQDPTLFIQILKNHLASDLTTATQNSANNTIRTTAEKKVATTFKNKPSKKWWFNKVLNKARDLVSNRENLRYERTRAYGIVRKMLTAIGHQMVQDKKLKYSRDIFYLELKELLQLDSYNDQELAKLVNQRKSAFAAYKTQPDPQDRFYTEGYNYSDAAIYSSENMEAITGDLQGIGCCPGQLKAKVQVIKDPSEIESLNGDILVTRSTDPGWVTLFPSASAVIVEKGSLLSHSAIVCREMGIPCIVSVDNLLRTLKTGDEIIMDGSTGTIQLTS